MKETFQESYFEGEMPHIIDDPFGYGTTIRTFSIIETKATPLGYEVILDMDLDSGYEIKGAKMCLTHDDLAGYETTDVQKAVQYALGFFDESCYFHGNSNISIGEK